MDDFYDRELEKLWKYQIRKTPLSLKHGLEILTKDDLTKIRQNLDLKGISNLNKAKLIDHLVSRIPANLERVFATFDYDRYNLVKSMIANGGYIKVDGEELEKLNYFRHHGIAFTGWLEDDTVLIMPPENIEVFKKLDKREYKEIIERNTMWVDLTKGILFYYGVLDFVSLRQRLAQYTQKEYDSSDLIDVLYSAAQYHYEIKFSAIGLEYMHVLDGRELHHDQLLRDDIAYHEFSKLELLRASKLDYFDKTLQVKEFIKYFKKTYPIEEEDLNELLIIMNILINNNNGFNDLFELIQENFEIASFEEVQYIGELLMNIHNNTRLWVLKGNTPSEVSRISQPTKEEESNVIDLKTRKKIGRNDPCPCGSGKKYKRCCG